VFSCPSKINVPIVKRADVQDFSNRGCLLPASEIPDQRIGGVGIATRIFPKIHE